jgi:hypothetical protein
MNIRAALVSSLLFALLSPASAAPNVEEMATRAQQSLARDNKYSMISAKAFWGDASFMRECVPASVKIAAPFTIYFEVRPDGALGDVLFVPETKTAECIRQHVMDRRFPTPPGGAYVTKIDMRFSP